MESCTLLPLGCRGVPQRHGGAIGLQPNRSEISKTTRWSIARATCFVKTTFLNSASKVSKNGKSHVAPAGLQGGSGGANTLQPIYDVRG